MAKKDDTSIKKTEEAKVNNVNQHADTAKDKEILNKTDKINKSETSRIKKGDLAKEESVLKPPPATDGGAAVQDPLSMRNTDTTQLKRIKAEGNKDTKTVEIESGGGSDTVHLKVIKEKKKQLAGILTASQTIRLRPPSSSSDEATLESSVGDSGQTMKLKSPADESAAKKNAGTLKLKSSSESFGEGTLKIKEPAASSEGTLKIKESSATHSEGTLKIKESASSTVAPGGTLKMKTPGNDADKTASMSAQSGSGTMKMSAQKTTSSTKAQPKKRKESNNVAAETEEAGGLFTFGSVAALILISVMAFMSVSQWMALFVDKTS